jgi:hypothetical protein
MKAKTAGAVVLGGLFLILFLSAVLPVAAAWTVFPFQTTGPGTAMWSGRTFEVVVQGFLILAGVFSILMLLGPDRSKGGMPP